MSATVVAEPGAAKALRPIDVLRERLGPQVKRAQDGLREQQRVRRLLGEALRAGPKTVPQLATAAGLPSGLVLWHVMALRRYGRVTEVGLEDRYPIYALQQARP